MPYLDESKPKNCFRCQHLSASDDGYVCGMGFGEAQTIWTGDLALICTIFEERAEWAPLGRDTQGDRALLQGSPAER